MKILQSFIHLLTVMKLKIRVDKVSPLCYNNYRAKGKGLIKMANYYLKLTMHNNDYSSSLFQAGIALYDYFNREEWFPREEDLPKLLPIIQHLVNSFYNLSEYMIFSIFSQTQEFTKSIKYFDNLKIEFVNSEDLPAYNQNYEDIYVAMFKAPIGCQVLMI